MSDEELLIMYRKYKRKRMIIILVIIFILLIFLGIYLYFHFNNTSSPDLEKEPKEEVIVKDEVAPIIKLNIEKLEILKGDDIKYLEYVESVVDETDGDLISKLEYEEIDNSLVGEQNIIYSVSDNSGNTSQQILKVEIKEKEIIEEQPVVPPINNNQNNKNQTQKQPSNNTPKEEKQPVTPTPEETPKKEEQQSGKVVKYFLFSDGYTMKNVAEACASELKKLNKTGMCSPIQDENGIYLGMKLETN